MKRIIIIALTLITIACKQPGDNTQVLQSRMDSLESKLSKTYKPGFGEFMSSVQTHHAKLWFAGLNENWQLADFEIHEILEAMNDVQVFQAERKESQMIPMIYPALDSVNMAIEQKDLLQFKNRYTLLTNTCNKCHQAVGFDFNVVKIPDAQPFSNQDFKIKK